MEYFGDKLKAIRKAKQMTQGELAVRLRVSTAIIAAYEQGKSYPSVAVLINICDILGTSADYLLGISDELSISMGGLTDEEMQPFLQLIALVKQNREPKD
ncbi:helix-turn-helix domain-containing protein [Lactococcus hircilactis]|uniref:Helix-turn-helix domain-containing protein n=1 Tax=Lactococcus hircilactis TaxID=1494462 RepID=A0A7X1Z7T4_9LACT|nr:helix-turn-helix transcriptional regulator [Lactococcus hircilactis]MQW39418.1 helix-turn-helix domain-containing protein [Lactococcus hircilactis]